MARRWMEKLFLLVFRLRKAGISYCSEDTTGVQETFDFKQKGYPAVKHSRLLTSAAAACLAAWAVIKFNKDRTDISDTPRKRTLKKDAGKGKEEKKHILLISQYFYPETFRVNDMAAEWVKRGYKVTVLTGIPNYPMGKFFEGYGFKHRRRDRKSVV